MADVKWSALGATHTSVSSGGSLAAAAREVGAEYDNSSAKERYCELEFTGSWSTAPAANGFCTVYALTAPNGTDYQDGSSSVAIPATAAVAAIPIRAVTGAQRVHVSGVGLPPCKFKLVLQNDTGQTLSAGWTLRAYPYHETVG